MPSNRLYYGDNLEMLRHIQDASVDLIYLDPPFNSNQDYNVLFGSSGNENETAQIRAFQDTWSWDQAASLAYTRTVEQGGRVAQMLTAFRGFLGESNMMAYLAMMAPRLAELRRVLKPTGSIYLHCDPTASHYLKLLMDAVFGPESFRNEVVWKRTSAHNRLTRFGPVHDVILFYTRSDAWTWNPQHVPYEEGYVETFYRHVEEGTGRRYRLSDVTSNRPGGRYEWQGRPPPGSRYWGYAKEKMEEFEAAGRLVYSRNGIPSYKRYLDEMPGQLLQDVWTDIKPLGSHAKDRLGYPTQKPEELLERIILASSNEGDTVLDPFCGCGTSVVAAQKLKRKWIGIDITHLAINLIRVRLKDTFGKDADFEVIGEPKDLAGAQQLAKEDAYQFQWWTLGLVGARPVEEKKGADRGIDGRLYFHENAGGKSKQIIISVKAGHTGPAHIRDLRGVVEREGAEIGVLISLQEPTAAMRKEAAAAGHYSTPWGEHPRIQLITAAELLEGKQIDYPRTTGANVTLKKARKHQPKAAEPLSFLPDE